MQKAIDYLNECFEGEEEFNDYIDSNNEIWIDIFIDEESNNPFELFNNLCTYLKAEGIKFSRTSERDGGYLVKMLIIKDVDKLKKLIEK